MKIAKYSTFVFLSILISWSVTAQNSSPKLEGVDQEIEDLIESYGTIGVSVVIVKDDEIIYSKGFGYRDLEQKLEMTANTTMPIGSVTKSFTSSLIGILESQDRISIFEKPSFYIPKLQFYNDKMDLLITIEDLLSHKSGLGVMDASSAFFPVKDHSEFIPRFKYLEPTGEIKNSFQYSNVGFGLLGTTIENITGVSWGNYLAQEIFDPLSMKNSYSSIEQMLQSTNYSLGYGRSNNQELKVPFHEFSFIKSAGSISSSANDMGKYLIAWLNNGVVDNKQVLPSEYVKNAMEIKNYLAQKQATAEDFLFGYGYGWFVRSSKGKYLVEHGGGTSGFTSLLSMFPDQKLGIITLTNQHNSALPYYIKDIIINRMFDYTKKKTSDYPVNISEIYQIPDEVSVNEKSKPTNPMGDFIGRYNDQGHGDINIKIKEGKLFAHFPSYIFRLEHIQNNTFIMQGTTENSQFFNPSFQIDFNLNDDGNVSSFNINFHPNLVEFVKLE